MSDDSFKVAPRAGEVGLSACFDDEQVRECIISSLLIDGRQGVDALIAYLDESDFFIAPASTKYHGNYSGGLARHSLDVYNRLAHKTFYYGKLKTPCIIPGLMHDICKVGQYFRETKWRKNDETGKWESYKGWVTKDSMPLGHGEKSVIILQKFIDLTDLEIAMIRWHMGPFGLSPEQVRTFNQAVALHPEIVAMYTSDYEVSTFLDEMREE